MSSGRLSLLIKDALVYDGTGRAPFVCDVGIEGDTIVLVGKVDAGADHVIDASGLALAPGFIDTHAHSEFTLLASPQAEGKLLQGVTTEVNGNCGLSAGPLIGPAKERREPDQQEYGITQRWESLSEYFHLLEGRVPALNYATLVGHGNIRASVMGYREGPASQTQMDAMKSLVADAVSQGAIGMSTGLIYPPGIYTNTQEITQLTTAGHMSASAGHMSASSGRKSAIPGRKSAISGHKSASSGHKSAISGHKSAISGHMSASSGRKSAIPGHMSASSGHMSASSGHMSAISGHSAHSPFIYTSHMRSEGDMLLQSIDETFAIATASGCPVHVSHIKTAGRRNWHKAQAAIAAMHEARVQGLAVSCDRYPYIAAATDLDSVLPAWAFEGGNEAELARLRDPLALRRMREALSSKPDEWADVRVSDVGGQANKWAEGLSIDDIAVRWGMSPFDALVRLLLEERLRVGAIFHSMCQENLELFLSQPYCMVGSDSSVRSLSGPTRRGRPHPRGFGSFPRFLRMVIDGQLSLTPTADSPHMEAESGTGKGTGEGAGEGTPLALAIMKITSLAARTFGLYARGEISEGMRADLVVFDPSTIRDSAGYETPFSTPHGIVHVIVNGVMAVRDGAIAPERAGRVLRHGRDAL